MSTPQHPEPAEPSPWAPPPAPGAPAPSPGYAAPPPAPEAAPPYGSAPPPPPGYGYAGGYAVAPTGPGPVGRVRGTGISILLTIVTFGIYSWFWWYKTHEEMKRHTGEGLGGGIALVLAIFVGIVMPFLTSDEVGKLYERRGQAKPVTAATGLWYFPGVFILVGPIVWFVKTNGALNAYWGSMGAIG